MGIEMEATQIMMRQQMVRTLTELLEADERLVTLLGNSAPRSSTNGCFARGPSASTMLASLSRRW